MGRGVIEELQTVNGIRWDVDNKKKKEKEIKTVNGKGGLEPRGFKLAAVDTPGYS